MESAGAVLKARNAQRLAARNQILNNQSIGSIEISVSNTYISSIETTARSHRHQPADECFDCLPREIDDLIDVTGKNYRRKYRKMIKDGYLRQLLQLVRYTRSMETSGKLREEPCHFFATYAKNGANWASTLKTLAEQIKVQKEAARVAAKVGADLFTYICKQLWQGVNVERWADLAQEMPHDKPGQSKAKHFVWLCRREVAAAAGAQ